MNIKKRTTKFTIITSIILSLCMPLDIEARSVRSSVRVSRPSTVKVSRPSTIKPGKSTLRPASSSKTVKGSSTLKTTKNKTTKATNKTTIKADSADGFSTKPQTLDLTKDTSTNLTKTKESKNTSDNKSTHNKKSTKTSYYNSYDPNRYYNVRSNLSVWDYYMLTSITGNKNKISEQEIVKALEEKGYSEKEAKEILNDINKDIKENNKKEGYTINKFFKIISSVIITSIIAVVGFLFVAWKR